MVSFLLARIHPSIENLYLKIFEQTQYIYIHICIYEHVSVTLNINYIFEKKIKKKLIYIIVYDKGILILINFIYLVVYKYNLSVSYV